MSATILDGKATKNAIFDELRPRVAALAEQGRTPGLATVLVGDDPASHSYVRGKHNDCAQVGIESIRKELPADIGQAELEGVIDELNADPACTGYIVQLPVPDHLDTGALLQRVDVRKDADGLNPVSLGRLVLGEPAPLPCTPRGIVELLRRYGVELNGPTSRSSARDHRRQAPGAAADPAQRERDRHVVPHGDQGRRRRAGQGRCRGGRGGQAESGHTGHDQAGCRRSRRGGDPR